MRGLDSRALGGQNLHRLAQCGSADLEFQAELLLIGKQRTRQIHATDYAPTQFIYHLAMQIASCVGGCG